MKLNRKWTTFGVCAAAILAASWAPGAQAQGKHACAYANDNISGANTVDGYSVTAHSDNYLQPVATGGQGAPVATFFATPLIAIAPHSMHLYAADSSSSDIALFNINPANCQLSHAANYPSGGDGSFGGLGIVISPDGKFLYAENSGDPSITVLGINSDGSLTAPVQTVAIPELLVSMAITPDGKTLITTQSGETQVMAYSINATTGMLAFSSGVHTSGAAAGVAIDSRSRFLYIGTGANDDVEVQIIQIGAGSQLKYVADDFFLGGLSGNCLALSPNGRFLYVTNQISATVLTLNVAPRTGALTFNNTAADGESFVDEPSQLAIVPGVPLVFTGDFNTDGVPAMGILHASANGVLAATGYFPLAAGSGPTSIAVGLF